MGFWNSVMSTLDKVAGTSARVYLEGPGVVVNPGSTVKVNIIVENGGAELDVRQVLLEVRAMEYIDVPKTADLHAYTANVLRDAGAPRTGLARSSLNHDDRLFPNLQTEHYTYKTSIRVGESKTLAPNQKVRYEGKFTFPSNVQPTYSGKYCHHTWQIRGRVDILGTDPNSGWVNFQVCVPS